MKTRTALVLLATLLLGACGAAGTTPAITPEGPDQTAGPEAMLVWTEHIAHKVQPTTAAGAGSSIHLEGARRSYEAAQIVVRAEGGALSGVNLAAGDLRDGAGHSIPAANVSFFRQAFIDFTGVEESEPGSLPVPANSPTGDPWMPDPLIPFTDPYSGTAVGAPFAVPAGQNQPVWVDVWIPENTAAGTYSGAITVTASGQVPAVVPLTLVVWDLVLPDPRVVTTYFDSYFEQVIYFHRDTYDCSGGSCWLDWDPHARLVVKRYEELAHAHRIDTGQSFIPEPESGGDCTVPYDWSAYDAAVQPYADGSYWSDGVPSSWIDTPFSPGVSWGFEGDCSEAEYTALAAAWAAHFKAQGWFTRSVVYAYDEPPADVYDEIALHAGWMQNGDPDWKAQIMDTVSARPDSVGILNPALGIYCECLRCYDHWYQGQDNYGRAEWPDLFAQGIQLWFYESNAQSDPFPTFATNTLLGVEPRIVLWGSWYEQATGFLLWDTMAWDRDDPWGPNVDYGKSGDGVLVYPGHHDGLDAPLGSPADVVIDGPVPSYRLKVIRAGLQDWALFRLAEQHGLGDFAREQVAQVYGQFGGCDWSGCPPPENGSFYWLSDAALMDQIRHDIAMAILGGNQAPHVPSDPRPADGAAGVLVPRVLGWQGGDPDGGPVTYTLALGSASPPAAAATVTRPQYAPALLTGTTYYWQITATDGLSTSVGPLWQFSTASFEALPVYLPLLLKG